MHSPSPAAASHFVKSVLAYLEGMHKLASIMNDRAAREHFDDCWSQVWRAYYGGYSLPVAYVVTPVTLATAPVPASKPPWYTAKFSRPTRKVVARTTEKIDMGKRYPALTVHYDVLECGHRLPGNENHGAAPPARHRRCNECQAVAATIKEANVRRGKRPVAHAS